MITRVLLPTALVVLSCVVFGNVPVNIRGIILIIASIATSELIHEVFYGYI